MPPPYLSYFPKKLGASGADYDALPRVLADKFHLIARDCIGFGTSEAPEHGVFAYTFENLTDYVAGLIEAIGIERYVLQRPPIFPWTVPSKCSGRGVLSDDHAAAP